MQEALIYHWLVLQPPPYTDLVVTWLHPNHELWNDPAETEMYLLFWLALKMQSFPNHDSEHHFVKDWNDRRVEGVAISVMDKWWEQADQDSESPVYQICH